MPGLDRYAGKPEAGSKNPPTNLTHTGAAIPPGGRLTVFARCSKMDRRNGRF